MKKLLVNEITENLKDAGCNNKLIEEIIKLYDMGKKEKIKEILSTHRKEILDNEHKAQKQIDCLDFFLYQIEKEDKRDE